MSTPKKEPNWQQVAMTTHRSGQTARLSGIYGLFELDGTPYQDAGEFTIVKGEPFPPTPERHLVYGLIRGSHHKGDSPPEQEGDGGEHSGER